MASETPGQPTFVNLEPGSEWRFELEAEEDTVIRVQSPDPVFINAAEIPAYTWYPLVHGLKSSIYAPQGGRIEVSALPASQYISETTTQPALISAHFALEKQRILARRALSGHSGSGAGASAAGPARGPRVMVIGPPSSGKTTIVKSLVNMATSGGLGWTVGVASLDPSSPVNLIPGTLSLSTPTQPIPTHHLAHPLGPPPASAASSTLAADVGTVGWWYGHVEPGTKGVDLWERVVSAMGARWEEKCAKDDTVQASGLIVDTSAAFAVAGTGVRRTDPKARYPLVQHAVQTFGIDSIFVIGHEKLSIDLSRLMPSVTVVRLPKSGGVVDRDEPAVEAEHAQMVRSYFYGEPALRSGLMDGLLGKSVPRELSLTPYSFQIGWETLSVLRVGEENAAPTSALPLGSSRILSPTRLTRVDPTGPAHVIRLLNTVLAVVALQPGDRIRKDLKVKKEEKAEGVEGVEGAEAGGRAAAPESGAEGGAAGEAGAGADGEAEGGQDADAEEEEEDEDEVPWKEEIGWREVLGFVVITAVDTLRKKYTVLSPSPGKLPSKVAVAGAIEWVDSA